MYMHCRHALVRANGKTVGLLKHWMSKGGQSPVPVLSKSHEGEVHESNVWIENCGFDKHFNLIQIEGIGHVSVSSDTFICGGSFSKNKPVEATDYLAFTYSVGDSILVQLPDGSEEFRAIKRVAFGTRSDCYAYRVTAESPNHIYIQLKHGRIMIRPEVHNDLRSSKQ